MQRLPLSLFALIVGLTIQTTLQAAETTVLAAASLTNALSDIAKAYESGSGDTVKTSFAASSALAKQIENGAPAGLFISADLKWMDYLDGKGKIDGGSRVNLLGNRLVLVAPKGRAFAVTLEKGANLAAAFEGKLCTGETASVPVGIYAKEALQKLGMWEGIQTRVVGSEDVRAALAFVERAECAAAIVYATDAAASNNVETVGEFPIDSHAPIVYPAAMVNPAPASKAFLDYLQGEAAAAVFRKYGFRLLGKK